MAQMSWGLKRSFSGDPGFTLSCDRLNPEKGESLQGTDLNPERTLKATEDSPFKSLKISF